MNKKHLPCNSGIKHLLFFFFGSLLVFSCNNGNQKGNTDNQKVDSSNQASTNAPPLPTHIYRAYNVDVSLFLHIVDDPDFKTLVLMPTNVGTATNSDWTLVPTVEVRPGSNRIDATGLLSLAHSNDLPLNAQLDLPAPLIRNYRMERGTKPRIEDIKDILNVCPSLKIIPVDGTGHPTPHHTFDHLLCYNLSFPCEGGGGQGFNLDSFISVNQNKWKMNKKFTPITLELNPRPPGSE